VFTVVYAREHALLPTLQREQPEAVLPWLSTQAEPMLRRGISAMSAHVKQDQPDSVAHNKSEIEVEWGIRLVVSLITTPSVTRQLDTPADLRRYIAALLDIGTSITAPHHHHVIRGGRGQQLRWIRCLVRWKARSTTHR
jgi:hypothetical protein